MCCMKSAIMIGLIGLGILMFMLSAIWVSMFPGTASWTPEKETRLSEVSDRLHVLTFTVGSAEARPKMHGGPDLLKAKKELEDVKKEYAELSADFRGIQKSPHTITRILRWSGISMAVVGIIGWYATKQ